MTLNLPRLIFLYIFLFSFFSLFSQKESEIKTKPVYNSLLWEITGNGMSEPSYLYGTMHVSQKLAFHLGEPFFEAIESCAMVALELNPETWMKDLAETDLHQEAYSANSYHDNFYEDAFKFPVPKNREIAYHIASEDNLINGLLYRSSNYAVDFEEETYLDLYIFQTGRRMGKEIFSLEDYAEVMDYSRKAMVPDKDDQDINYRKLGEIFKDTSPQEVLQDSYRKGDLNLVDSVSKLMNPSKNFHKFMIVERNKDMAVNMDSIMQSGTSLFTGVGAAHLPGDYGVIELLRESGYTLNPVEKGLGGKSKVYQDKYDDVLVPFEYKKQSFDNDFYHVDAPGAMYSMPSMGNFITYLHPNMPNGAYYWVKRIKSYDVLMDRDMDYTVSRLDSMLYENIPGEIVSKKSIEGENYKGFDIVNKTRQGDIQRYQIYATPLEILIFKMGGSKNFTLDHGSRFFKSIDLNIPLKDNDSELVSPDEGGFSVELPKYHLLYRLRNGMLSGGPGLEYQALDSDGDFYMMRKTVLNDPDFIEEDKFELKQFIKSIAADVRFTRKMTKPTTYLSYPAIDATYEVANSNKKLHVRVIVKGAEYFFLAKYTGKKFEKASEYFNSMTFDDPVYTNSFEELVDSSMCFKTNTAVISKEMEMMRESQKLYFQDLDQEEDDFAYNMESRTINSSQTGEDIVVTMEKYNAFEYRPNIDSLWNDELRRIKKEFSMNTNNVVKSVQDSIYMLDVLCTDTGSTRGIKVRKILSNRRIYTLKTTVDTLGSASDFVNETYENFALLPDENKVLSLFEKKTDMFFEFLESGDSLKMSRAIEYIGLITLESKDEPRLLSAINNFDFTNHGISDRASLIRLYAYIKTKSALSFLQNEYMTNENTVTYQLACLSALSAMNTLESRKMLLELMVNYPTIPSENSEINAIYTPLFDSLAISKVLFPDFMELSSFPEYKKNNLNLLSSLIYNGDLKPRVMKKYKRRLVNEGLIELKRQFASEEGGEEKKNVSWNMRNKMTRLNFDLLDYATIMAPWYDKDEKVRKFFSDVQRMKNKKTLTRLVCMMEVGGVPVKTTTWDRLAGEDESRSFLLKNMRAYNIEHLFNENYLTQDLMSYSQLVSEYQFDNDTTDIELIGKFLIESKEKPGYYYFYKAKRKGYYEDDYKWALYYNGPQPSDGTTVVPEGLIHDKSENIQPHEDYTKLLEELKLKLEMKGRKRYTSEAYDDFGY